MLSATSRARGRLARACLADASLACAALACHGDVSGSSTSDAAESGRAPDGALSGKRIDVLTQHNDVQRTGQNLSETGLTTTNVSSGTFGKLFTLPVDGYVWAQPLIVSQLEVSGATRNVAFIATAHNSVYAFDADTGGAAIWQTSLGPSVPSSAILNGRGSQNILVEVGILSTPVIDRTNGLLYVTCETYVGSVVSHTLHVLHLTTGKEMPGSPVAITASVPGGGDDNGPMLTFDPTHQAQRPALLLFSGTVYLAYGSQADAQPYHGWILGYRYDAGDETLTQTSVFNTTPDGTQGGIWQSGQGLLTDGTSLYAATGNGAVTAQNDGGASYGESFLRLSPGLEVLDWFTPISYASLNRVDLDLGAGGPVLIPGTTPPTIVGGGKQGILYLVDTTNMGHLASGPGKNVEELMATNAIFGAPVVWTAAGATRLYLWGKGDVVKQFTLTDGVFGMTPTTTSPSAISTQNEPSSDQVGNLAVSSDGDKSGTGILWAAKPLQNPARATVPGMLYALDAVTLTELWDSLQVASRDDFGSFAKFVPPTVANGKVYMATDSLAVFVYGILAGG